MKISGCVMVLFMFVVSVNAQYASSGDGGEPTTAFGSLIQTLTYYNNIAKWLMLSVDILFVGGVAITIIVMLQYFGFDVIGWSLELFRFFFDLLFLIFRWCLASEANLISMIILFIIFWAIILFGMPFDLP